MFHYLPLHLAPAAAPWGFRAGMCPITENASDRLVRLPFFTTMSEPEQQRVIDAVRSFTA